MCPATSLRLVANRAQTFLSFTHIILLIVTPAQQQPFQKNDLTEKESALIQQFYSARLLSYIRSTCGCAPRQSSIAVAVAVVVKAPE